MSYGFYECSSLIEIPLLPSTVSNTSYMFYGASLFNQDISGWTTSAITNMSYMFYGASLFNQDISYWDTSLVQNMSGMFENATNFNRNLGSWSTSSVSNMSNMFNNATNYNGLFDNGSIYIGANNFISILNDEDIRFGTGDFTIEWYQYQTDTNSFPRIFQMGDYGGTGISIGVSIEGGMFYYWRNNSPTGVLFLSQLQYKNTWVHFAISRASGVTQIFMNGTIILTMGDTANFSSSSDLVIGN
jgi:surface protein